ncbi:MAG: TetR/AcrR family transcriptional regulator [Planctomycetota bacterium]|jgi:AcrR family transcriptional regulator
MAEPQAQADTRGALLDAAEGLFSKRGYAAVGIREITDAAGVNIAAIKYHFGSKSELYLQTVRRAMERSETAASYEVLREGISEPLEAATMLVRFIHLFLDRHMATESPSPVCSLILHEAAEPTEAIDSVVRDFIGPHERMHIELLRVLVPGAGRKQLMHYRIFKPVLERMAVGDLTDRRKIRSIADHIARFSLRGLGCSPDLVEEAVANAAEIERDAAPKQRAPK